MKNLPAIIFLLTAAAALPARAQLSAPSSGALPSLSTPILAPASPAATPAPAPIVVNPSTPAPQAFADGVAAYQKNDFAQARALFAVAEGKAVSAPLEYNFGNACFQAGDYGAAVLHYLRALALNPRDPDAQQNLALARRTANITVADPTRLENFADLLNTHSWAWVAAIAGWAAIYLAFLPRLYRWRGAMPWLLCATTAVIALAAIAGFYGAQTHARDGVVLRADTPVKLSPTENSPAIGTLQSGEVAQILEEHGGYFKVQPASGQPGWVDGTNYSPVWN
jgi:tetratricopeptide (TPR) repeat protein